VRSEALKAVIKIDADQGREIKEILKNDNRVSGDLSKILDSI
jgi:hypothetical protein